MSRLLGLSGRDDLPFGSRRATAFLHPPHDGLPSSARLPRIFRPDLPPDPNFKNLYALPLLLPSGLFVSSPTVGGLLPDRSRLRKRPLFENLSSVFGSMHRRSRLPKSLDLHDPNGGVGSGSWPLFAALQFRRRLPCWIPLRRSRSLRDIHFTRLRWPLPFVFRLPPRFDLRSLLVRRDLPLALRCLSLSLWRPLLPRPALHSPPLHLQARLPLGLPSDLVLHDPRSPTPRLPPLLYRRFLLPSGIRLCLTLRRSLAFVLLPGPPDLPPSWKPSPRRALPRGCFLRQPDVSAFWSRMVLHPILQRPLSGGDDLPALRNFGTLRSFLLQRHFLRRRTSLSARSLRDPAFGPKPRPR